VTEFRVETIQLDLPRVAAAFSRRLHDAGVPVTPERPVAFARALGLVRPVSRRHLYWTARSVFVSDQAHVRAFDAVFRAVFGASDIAVEPIVETPREVVPREQAEFTGAAGGGDGDEEAEIPRAVAGDAERLASRRFDALEPEELAQLYRLMARLELAPPLRRTRRHERGRRGSRIDLRRTLRGGLRSGGEPIRLAHRRRRLQRRRLVMLCDISGSMEPYARAYLQLLAAAAGSGPSVEAFAFATRLTRLTRALRGRHPERAIQRAAATAPDWSSGTRIGDALKAFNDRHGRRGMARGSVVVIVSDGWERGDPELVGREMARLARLSHRIVWVNPRVGAEAFAVRAGGMVAALPHCDALVSGHSFEALGQVADAIAGELVPTPELPDEEPEPWASASPVPGSSVAMPSGYGPSRGNTTPGWSIGR
jgi:uncharacterized protein with von Willebrand factor type A (vWA) domain